MTVSDSEQESISSSSSKEGEIWKWGSGKWYDNNNDHSWKKIKQYTGIFLNLDDCIDTNFNYESLRSRLPNCKKIIETLYLLYRKI